MKGMSRENAVALRAIAYEKIKLRDKNGKAWYNEKKEETRGKIPWETEL